ncbi:MAG: hypothetical protein ABR529_00325 [Actinomycetota bacterium]
MTSAAVAALVATLAVGFVEGIGGLYPSRQTWWRLRRARGRRAVRAMRERFESAGARRAPKLLTTVLLALVIVWVAVASLLDKRWYEVVLDLVPYVIVYAALLRTPVAMHRIAERMKDLERESGEDPDAPVEGDGGPTALAL